MLPDYSDIIDRAGEPDWYDQHGAPRYGPFEPDRVSIYCNRATMTEELVGIAEFWCRRGPDVWEDWHRHPGRETCTGPGPAAEENAHA